MQKKTTPSDALTKLKEGNTRFMEGKANHPNSDDYRRLELLNGQTPFATIITCSDSRVPPEIIFDCGIGDLFVIRVAGNIVDQVVLGSVLYATEHLSCPLVVVLGHESCGAVTAAIRTDTGTDKEPAAIREIMSGIRSNIPKTLKTGKKDHEGVQRAVEENVSSITNFLISQTELAGRMSDGSLSVIPALYMFGTGEIIWK